jgi:hypothetical protein
VDGRAAQYRNNDNRPFHWTPSCQTIDSKSDIGGRADGNPMTASPMNPELFKKIQNEERQRKRRQHPTGRTDPFIGLMTMYTLFINNF